MSSERDKCGEIDDGFKQSSFPLFSRNFSKSSFVPGTPFRILVSKNVSTFYQIFIFRTLRSNEKGWQPYQWSKEQVCLIAIELSCIVKNLSPNFAWEKKRLKRKDTFFFNFKTECHWTELDALRVLSSLKWWDRSWF